MTSFHSIHEFISENERQGVLLQYTGVLLHVPKYDLRSILMVLEEIVFFVLLYEIDYMSKKFGKDSTDCGFQL